VDESILASHEVHERAEIDDVHDLAVVDLADFGFLDNAEDPLLGGFDFINVARRDLDHAFIVDVDLGAGFSHDFADHLAAGADDVADLRLVDLDRFDARRVLGNFGAGRAQRLGHFAQDVRTASLGLFQCLGHDFLRDAGNLDVHLHGGDAVFGARNLEVHIAQVIFITQNVGQDGEFITFQDQAHRDARNRRLHRHAGIHHRQTPAAHRRHRGRAVGLGDVRQHADGIGEVFLRRQDRVERAPRQFAVADFAAV